MEHNKCARELSSRNAPQRRTQVRQQQAEEVNENAVVACNTSSNSPCAFLQTIAKMVPLRNKINKGWPTPEYEKGSSSTKVGEAAESKDSSE